MSTPTPMPGQAEVRDILNYTIVAVIGMLAGIMVGYLFGYGARSALANTPPPATQRP